ncbi:MAG: PaaI family thioesterase [Pseudomonadales bacterium]|nr:PaaI family thioesterase [Pseudomonadales bacterium]
MALPKDSHQTSVIHKARAFTGTPMSSETHYRALEAMYQLAPNNEYYKPSLTINEGTAEISIDVKPNFFHTAGGVHGSVYFKLLDDAAFFAANSLEPEVFVLTTSFTTYITRPINSGIMIAKGKVVNKNRTQWIVESIVYDGENREIGRGNGIFVRSKNALAEIPGYKDYIAQY